MTLPYARKVVAIVLNWNGWSDTADCIESLLAGRVSPHQIVVCDNGSTDGSVEQLEAWAREAGRSFVTFDTALRAAASEPSGQPLIFIRNGRNGGYAAGNNVGIRYALERLGADFVWIVNNDAVAGEFTLERMLESACERPDAAIVGSALLEYGRPGTIQALGGGAILPLLCHDTRLGHGRAYAEVPAGAVELEHVIGASLLVRSEAIRDVGLIDESYFLYREETDWCIRMRRGGWRLLGRCDAPVWHRKASSIGFKSALHDYYSVRNMLRLVRKFYPLALPAALLYHGLRALLPKLARLQFVRAAAVIRAIADFAAGVTGRLRTSVRRRPRRPRNGDSATTWQQAGRPRYS